MPERIVGPFGRNTNHPFTIFPNSESTAKRLTVWSGQMAEGAQGFTVIKGIEIKWFNGETKSIYNHQLPDDKQSSFEFHEGETAEWSIRAGWRIVRFELKTSTGRSWGFGGDSGDLFPNIANGKLVGFELSSGWEIDWAKITFEEE